ncbi:hypothetical protein [Brevibacillus sp. NRS-1366]|uniref:hypothetical protein n=1 Tax=Brevibacillus sp. NRS-1366 TaxID=3233899 RepID=UPI003D20E670
MIDRTEIEAVVREILQKLKLESSIRPNLVVLNAATDFEVEQLEQHWNVISMPPTSNNFPANVQDAVFLNVTQDLLVKGALGIVDTPECKMLSQLLLKGVRISFIPSVDLEWILDFTGKEVANSAYGNHLASYKKMLEGFGVQVIPLVKLVPKASHDRITFHGKLVTQREIEHIKDEKIWIHKSTIVTPLARDAAREKGKSICVID